MLCTADFERPESAGKRFFSTPSLPTKRSTLDHIAKDGGATLFRSASASVNARSNSNVNAMSACESSADNGISVVEALTDEQPKMR